MMRSNSSSHPIVGEVTEDPLDVRTCPGPVEHGVGGVEPAEPPGVTRLPGLAQQLARSAADIEHRSGRHHEREVEAEVGPLARRVERVVQPGEIGLENGGQPWPSITGVWQNADD